jgi:hypothetical protein
MIPHHPQPSEHEVRDVSEQECQHDSDPVMASYEWRGKLRRDGTASGGVWVMVPSRLPAVVKDRFDQGWDSLTVTRDGAEMGGIWLNPSNLGRRDWWAEGDEPLRQGGSPLGPVFPVTGLSGPWLCDLSDGDLITIQWSGELRTVAVVVTEGGAGLRDLSDDELAALAAEVARVEEDSR